MDYKSPILLINNFYVTRLSASAQREYSLYIVGVIDTEKTAVFDVKQTTNLYSKPKSAFTLVTFIIDYKSLLAVQKAPSKFLKRTKY